eukprot:907833-Rhodomonas_salina.1
MSFSPCQFYPQRPCQPVLYTDGRIPIRVARRTCQDRKDVFLQVSKMHYQNTEQLAIKSSITGGGAQQMTLGATRNLHPLAWLFGFRIHTSPTSVQVGH